MMERHVTSRTYDASPFHLRSAIRRLALVRLALHLDGRDFD